MQRGMILALLSTLFFGLMGTLVKIASHLLETGAIVFYRSFFSFLLVLILMLYEKRKIAIKNWSFVLLRSITGALALILFFKSISLTTLGEATVLCYTYPLFSSLLSFISLKEPTSYREIIAMLIALIGIWLIVNPHFSFQIQPGHIYGLLSGLMAGVAVFSLRVARKTDDSLIIVFVFMGVVAIMSLPLYIHTGLKIPGESWLFLILIGLFGGIAQLLITVAYKYCRVIVCSTISLMTVAVSVLFSVLLLKESYSFQSIVGMLLVLMAIVFINYSQTSRTTRTTALPPQ